MNHSSNRNGSAMRIMIGTLLLLLLIPAILLIDGMMSLQNIDAQQIRPPQAQSQPIHDERPQANVPLLNPNTFRPVFDTVYEQQRQQVPVVAVDQETGKSVMTMRETVIHVPKTITRYVPDRAA